ncbi:hypothetical protein [Clostridium ganghwense]|nr:hypothetical protein [Clostridium ganghwense]
MSPLLNIGLLMFVIYVLIDKFIAPLSDWIAIPALLIAIALIIIGRLRSKNDNKQTK